MVNQNRTETNSNPKRMVRFPSLIQGDWRLYTGSYITGCSLQNKQQPSVCRCSDGLTLIGMRW